MTETLTGDGSIARRSIPLLDLTNLDDACVAADVELLCERATGRHGNVAAVCVWPRFVGRAVAALDGTGVRIATVVDFPGGDQPIGGVVTETLRALEDGAHEVDAVLHYRALLAGRDVEVADCLAAVREAVPRTGGRLLKVILETGELPDQETVARAARMALDQGADFLKTSTGKTPVSATPVASATMLEAIRERGAAVGLKPSGGIRTVADARTYLAQADEMMGTTWVSPTTFRFGASSLLDALERALDDEAAGERGGA